MKIVYILVNESMPDVIKIGITENIERRVKELDGTSIPLPFECYHAVEVEDSQAASIEQRLHRALEKFRVRKNREFFNFAPENAKDILKIAEDMGGKDVTPKADIVETDDDRIALENARSMKKVFEFNMINMGEGTVLEFAKDRSITCEVVDNRRVNFRGEITSLSKAAWIVLNEMGYDSKTAAGPRYWTYKGQNLSDIRRENEV